MSEHVRAALAAVIEGRTLDLDEARRAMGEVMDRSEERRVGKECRL